MTQFPPFSARIFQHRLLTHVLFWFAYLLFFSLINGPGDPFLESLSFELILVPVTMAAVYLTIYVLIPRFLLQQRYWEFALGGILLLLVAGLLQRVLIYHIIYPIQYEGIDIDFVHFWLCP